MIFNKNCTFSKEKSEIGQNEGPSAVEIRQKLAQNCDKAFRSEFQTRFWTRLKVLMAHFPFEKARNQNGAWSSKWTIFKVDGD